MKTTRFLKVAAALTLAACTLAPMAMMNASAGTIKINEVGSKRNDGEALAHKYNVYKIFSGTVVVDETAGTSKLENITFAAGDSNFASFLTELKGDSVIGSKFTSCNTVGDVATVLSGFNNQSADANALAAVIANNASYVTKVNTEDDGAAVSSPITLADDGYYAIIEAAPTATDLDGKMPLNWTLSDYILQQYDADGGALNIDAKSAVPTVEKKIWEDNLAIDAYEDRKNNDYGGGFNDTADHCIGDTVPFLLVGTLPTDYADFDTYQYKFHDTLGSQFTLDEDSIEVYVDGNVIPEEPEGYTANYTITQNTTGFDVEFTNLKILKDAEGEDVAITKDSIIAVKYNTTLNDTAVIGQNGQFNEVYLEFSNNVNNGVEGTSVTEKDKVVAFTYELDVTKKDMATDDELKGAKFALYRTVDSVNYYAKFDSNGIIEDWISGSFNTDGDFTPTTSTDNSVETLTLYGNTVTDETKATLTNGAETCSFVGLDDDTYYLEEIIAPVGYVKVTTPWKLEIVANTTNSQDDSTMDGKELASLVMTVNDKNTVVGNVAEGDLSGHLVMDVMNSSSATLPETGGIGTKIFLFGGGTMACVAGLYLITKKRAKGTV